MTVLHPAILVAGLAAASIPILIHLLFRRRRPPIAWAAMDLLLEAYRRQRRRLRLEQLLLLACRCLIFGLAGLAIARPVLESTGLLGAARSRTVALIIDDGLATRHHGDGSGAAAFDRIKLGAAALVRDLEPGDEVAVYLAASPVRALLSPPSSDREAVARAIEQLDARWGRTDLPAAIEAVRPLVADVQRGEPVVVILSEFRAGSLDPTLPSPSPIDFPRNESAGGPRILFAAPAESEVETVAVVALDVQRAVGDEGVDVTVRLARSGGGNPARSVRLFLESEGYAPTAPRTVLFEAGQESAVVEQQLRPIGDRRDADAGAIIASVTPDDMPGDDRRHAWFDPRTAVLVGVVTRRAMIGGDIEQVPAARWLMRALAPADQPGLEVLAVEPASVDTRTLRDLDAVFLPRPDAVDGAGWAALREFVDAGGLLVAMPAPSSESRAWTDRLLGAFDLPWTIDADPGPLDEALGFAPLQPPVATSELFAAVAAELPDLLRPVEVLRRVLVGNARGESVLLLEDGSPFLLAAPPGAGSRGLFLFMTAAPELASTNLPVKPFMVPFAQELVRRGLAGIGRSARAEAGRVATLSQREAVEAALPDGARIPILERTLVEAPEEPGLWRLFDAGGRTIGGLAVNVELAGARLEPQSNEVIGEWLSAVAPSRGAPTHALGERLRPARDSTAASVWLLAAVLLLALAETIIARRSSHASSDETRADPGVGAQASQAGLGRAAA